MNIHWPAIIDYSGHAELGFIHNLAEWQEASKLKHTFQSQDRLIDAHGYIYTLNSPDEPLGTGSKIQLDILIQRIQEHASHIGMCCVEKFSANSIEEAIHIANSLAD